MDCAGVRKELLKGAGNDISDAARAHAETCSACELLLADEGATARRLGESSGVPMDTELELAAVERRIGAEHGLRASIRAARTVVRVGAVVAVVLVMSSTTLVWKPRADLEVYPLARLIGGVLGLLAAALVALWTFVRPIHLPRVSRSRLGLTLALGVILPFVLAVLPQAHSLLAVSLAGAGSDLLQRAASCLATGLAVSAPLLGAAWLIDRRGATASWPLAAVMGGLVGNLVLELHCSLTAPIHLVLGHASVTVLTVVLVAAFAAAYRMSRAA